MFKSFLKVEGATKNKMLFSSFLFQKTSNKYFFKTKKMHNEHDKKDRKWYLREKYYGALDVQMA